MCAQVGRARCIDAEALLAHVCGDGVAFVAALHYLYGQLHHLQFPAVLVGPFYSMHSCFCTEPSSFIILLILTHTPHISLQQWRSWRLRAAMLSCAWTCVALAVQVCTLLCAACLLVGWAVQHPRIAPRLYVFINYFCVSLCMRRLEAHRMLTTHALTRNRSYTRGCTLQTHSKVAHLIDT